MQASPVHASADLPIEEIGPPPDPGSSDAVVQARYAGTCSPDPQACPWGLPVVPGEAHRFTGADSSRSESSRLRSH